MIRYLAVVLPILLLMFPGRPALGDGVVAEGAFHSDRLSRNYPYMIYLPDGYQSGAQHYPVVYLLHGSFGNHQDWVKKGRLKRTVDRLVEEGIIKPMVIVTPGSRSWWIDGHNEDAGSAFIEDLIPHIEQTYRVVPEREWRAVAGLSAGGYGAINFMMLHPERFVAAAAFSPAIYDPLPPSNSTAWRHPAFLDNAIFDREIWRQNMYTAHLDDYLSQNRVVPLYLTVGDRDPLNATGNAALLKSRLEPHQPGLVTREVLPGGHTWGVWRPSLVRGLEFLTQYLRTPLPAAAEKILEREP
ncbi:MAG: alpha/beta hydrolase [Pseudomonadota bacterium]